MLMRTPTRWTRPTRRAPPGFILPAQPVLALKPPIGPGWLFAVKHDGFRIVARKEGERLHLWSRNGRNWSAEFSGITAALNAWKLTSFVLDGEACARDESGWPDFNALESRWGGWLPLPASQRQGGAVTQHELGATTTETETIRASGH